jgi:hypothetical protein
VRSSTSILWSFGSRHGSTAKGAREKGKDNADKEGMREGLEKKMKYGTHKIVSRE